MTVRELLPTLHRHAERGLHFHVQAAKCKPKPKPRPKPMKPKR